MYIPLKPLFSRHKGIGVQFTDEPTGNLDQKTSGAVMELLHQVHQEFHKTCLIVTHDMHVAEGADYILEMEDGLIK